MPHNADFITLKRKTLLFYLVIAAALAIVTPVLADYLGPNRTVTEWTRVCKIDLMECQYVSSKNVWRYKKVGDWSCSLESKPWKSYPSQPSSQGCFAATEGDQYWEQNEVLQQATTDYPPATIIGTLQNCTLQNGWCVTVPQLDLSANEPVSGYNILAIEGTLNGQTFACPNANCSLALIEGDNDFAFWAISSWGDSSTMENLSAKVDSISPSVGLDINGSTGTNGWFVSPVLISASGADSGSGLAEASLSIDSGVWKPSANLNEGIYNISVRAIDNAGNITNSSTSLSVDTTTPAISITLDGTLGANGWYKTSSQVTAAASDSTSGIGSLEISLDSGGYQAYTSPVSFTDGNHGVKFRATDHAGNVTESNLQSFSIDTLPPEIFIQETWSIGETVSYKTQDPPANSGELGSGLASLRIVIEDEDERFAKVAWNEDVSGEKYRGSIEWDGKFKDGTVAPPGTYFAWIKVSDAAGNETVALGRIIVPEPNSLLRIFKPESASTTIPSPPTELFGDDDVLPFKSTELESPTKTTVEIFGGLTARVGSTPIQSLSLNAGSTSSLPSSSNVLWGATAAAVLGAATAYALEENRKRREAEEAQRIAIVAQIEEMDAQREAAAQARKVAQWLEGQQLLNSQIENAKSHGATETEISELKKAGATLGFGAAIDSTKNLISSLERKKAEIDRQELEEEKDLLKNLAKRKIKVQEEINDQPATLPPNYEARKQREPQEQEGNTETPLGRKTWWQKSLDWIDNHQVEISLGIGIAVGVGAIILSGGTATPLVAAAWIAGAAMVAGGTVALGTVGLNAYYQRPLETNVLKNVLLAASAAAVTATAGFLLNAVAPSATRVIGTFCTGHVTTCAVAGPVFKAIDYGWTTYDVWQSQRTLANKNSTTEAKLIATVNIGLAAWSEGLEPDEALPISLPLDDVIRREMTEKFAEILEKEGKEAAFDYLKKILGDVPLSKLGVLDDDVLEFAAQEGPDALKALAGWPEEELKQHGVELALRAKKDGEVLKDIETLISKGPIDPKNLTKEQEQLIKAIAKNSTQYDEAGQIVLGKWVDFDGGFAEVARETGSGHYNPHPDMWNLLEKLGKEQREEVAWLINQDVIQIGIEKGLPFEYTLKGISANDIPVEQKAVQMIFSGKSESEIMEKLNMKYLPVRLKELQELHRAGYELIFDDVASSFILSLP